MLCCHSLEEAEEACCPSGSGHNKKKEEKKSFPSLELPFPPYCSYYHSEYIVSFQLTFSCRGNCGVIADHRSVLPPCPAPLSCCGLACLQSSPHCETRQFISFLWAPWHMWSVIMGTGDCEGQSGGQQCSSWSGDCELWPSVNVLNGLLWVAWCYLKALDSLWPASHLCLPAGWAAQSQKASFPLQHLIACVEYRCLEWHFCWCTQLIFSRKVNSNLSVTFIFSW